MTGTGIEMLENFTRISTVARGVVVDNPSWRTRVLALVNVYCSRSSM